MTISFFSNVSQISRAISSFPRAIGEADVIEEHGAAADETAGVGVLDASLLDHARRAAVDRLEHRVALADIGAAGGADAALKLRRLVGQDVAVEVGQSDDAEVRCVAWDRRAWPVLCQCTSRPTRLSG